MRGVGKGGGRGGGRGHWVWASGPKRKKNDLGYSIGRVLTTRNHDSYQVRQQATSGGGGGGQSSHPKPLPVETENHLVDIQEPGHSEQEAGRHSQRQSFDPVPSLQKVSEDGEGAGRRNKGERARIHQSQTFDLAPSLQTARRGGGQRQSPDPVPRPGG